MKKQCDAIFVVLLGSYATSPLDSHKMTSQATQKKNTALDELNWRAPARTPRCILLGCPRARAIRKSDDSAIATNNFTFQSRADRSNLVRWWTLLDRRCGRSHIYRVQVAERWPALGRVPTAPGSASAAPESPVREPKMFVTCRARYVRRTLARPRTRPQRPAAVS
jgi:hypothetical protein